MTVWTTKSLILKREHFDKALNFIHGMHVKLAQGQKYNKKNFFNIPISIIKEEACRPKMDKIRIFEDTFLTLLKIQTHDHPIWDLQC